MPPILFASQSYVSRSLPLSAQRCVNMFAEREDREAKSQLPLFGAPGLTSFATCGTGPVRGLYNMLDNIYAVSGNAFYSISPTGVATQVGLPIISGSSVVSMDDNGVQLCIVNGTQGFIYTPATNTLVQITDENFFPADIVTYFDTYFVFNRKGTNEFFLSNQEDGLTYNGLDFATAEAESDLCVGCVQNLELLFIFGQKHIELWYDAGTEDFPFQRYAGAVIPRGCIAPQSIIKQDGAIFFLGDDGIIYRLQGNVPLRISTHPIETLISGLPDVMQCQALTYTLQGHKMVAFTFPASNHTIVWDISTSLWHERESWDDSNNTYGRWRGNCALQMPNQQIYVGDQYSGAVAIMDWNAYTELGNTIQALVHSVPLHSDRKRLFISRLEFDMEAGVGLTAGQGNNPQIMLRWSKDGARTWSILQPWVSLGMIGQYLTRQRYLRRGQGRQFVFELTISDPVRRVLIAAHADISVGM